MDEDAAKLEIKQRYAELLQPAKVRGTYICPICGNGTGKDGTGIALEPKSTDGLSLKCFVCGTSGDIIHYYRKAHACGYHEALDALAQRLGIVIDYEDKTPAKSITEPHRGIAEPVQQLTDYREYYLDCMDALPNSERALDYLSSRGISYDTACEYWVGYDGERDELVIPATSTYYTGRAIDSKAARRYSNPKGAPVALFGAESLYNQERKPVYIVEGALDALSIAEVGEYAVGLNSASNTRLLIEQLQAKRTSNTLVLALDNDEAGRKASERLSEQLHELGITHRIANIYGSCKDANEALLADREALRMAILDTANAASKPDNTSDYLRHDMAREIETIRKQSNIKTGWPHLDEQAGSLYAGLYVLGAISSLGKTTWAAQLADQLAKQGKHVLIWSLEQSRLELVTKSLARQAALAQYRKSGIVYGPTSIEIRTGQALPLEVEQATLDYLAAVGERVSIIEGSINSCTPSAVRDYVSGYIERNNIRPVVVIDYLQVLQPDIDPETHRRPTDAKLATDANITALKRISRDYALPVIAISSINRANYLTPIDFEAFKESGAIEYTADVILGLQLTCLETNDIFAREGHIKDKRDTVHQAKQANPRKIKLVCLKNRFGPTYSDYYDYYPANDLFLEAENATTSAESAAEILKI